MNAKYTSISNILHLLSAAGPVPHAEPIPGSLVVDSSTLVSFSIVSLIVVLSISASRVEARNLELFIVMHWTDFC